MNRSRATVLVAATLLIAALPAMATSVFYDFGDVAAAGNYNIITQVQAPIANSIDGSGAPTGIGFEVDDLFYPNYNPNGTQAPTGDAAVFDAGATRDSLFGCTGSWYGESAPTGGFLMTGLNPALTYDFTFFASRTGVTDNREAQYDVVGLNSATTYLDSANNESNVAVISGIMPTASGEIGIDVSKGPNNTNGTGFFYIGAIKMDYVPEPASLALLLLGGVAVLRRR